MKSSPAVRNLLFLATAVIVSSNQPLVLGASGQLCEEQCTSVSDCSQECYETQVDFENGNPTTCLDYGVYDESAFCCGDNKCNLTAEETCGTCSTDCGACLSPTPTCGVNGCEEGENCENCATDCGGCGSESSCDNDNKCESGEGKDCEDCQKTGFCNTDSDCPNFNSGIHYVCIDDACVMQDLPSYTTLCDPTNGSSCPIGYSCKYSDAYDCPASSPDACAVCVPNWVL